MKRKLKFLTVYSLNQCSWYLGCSKPSQRKYLYKIKERYKSCLINLVGSFHLSSSILFIFHPKASSCDQELQSALEEAKQPQKDNVFIPECAQGGLYKPVQCHPSTGYCWCVLVDTGRPIPGTSTR